MTADATLGRVWKATLQCHADQQTLDGTQDNQMTSQELLQQLINIWDEAGRRAYLYVSSLTDPDLVETVAAVLESYSFKSKRPTPTLPVDVVEGTMDVTFVESL